MLPVLIALHRWILRTDDIVVLGHWLRLTYVVFFVSYVVSRLLYAPAVFADELFVPGGSGVHAPAPYDIHVGFMLSRNSLRARDRSFHALQLERRTKPFPESSPGRDLVCAAHDRRARSSRHGSLKLSLSRRLKQAGIRALVSVVPVLCWMGYVAHVEASHEYKNPTYQYQRADYVYTNVSYARNLRYKDSFRPELGYASLRDRARGFVRNTFRMAVNLGEAVSTKEPIWDLLRSAIDKRVGSCRPAAGRHPRHLARYSAH